MKAAEHVDAQPPETGRRSATAQEREAAVADLEARIAQLTRELARSREEIKHLNAATAQRVLALEARAAGMVEKRAVTAYLAQRTARLRRKRSRLAKIWARIRAALRPKKANISILRRSLFFDRDWYLATYADVAKAGLNPAKHYLTMGAKEGRDPGPFFSTRDYLASNPDVAEAGVNPLLYFESRGWREKRALFGAELALTGAAVTETEIYCLKKPTLGGEVALFVTHSPHGKLKPHVRHYLDSLKRQDIGVVLIVAADAPFLDAGADLLTAIDGVFVRRNEGYDFAAWAHILKLHPELFNAKVLYLLNDSLVGPSNDNQFGILLKIIRESPADVIGLTDSYEYNWHLQSYFVALKARALSSVSLHKFINGIVSYTDKDRVIKEYELRFAPSLKAAGLICEPIFPSTPGLDNRTIFDWKNLFKSGFPFIKVMTIRDRFANVDASDWREMLAEQGYDVSLAERTLAEAAVRPQESPTPAQVRAPLSSAAFAAASGPIKVAFIGPWNYNNGLAVASRGYVSALRRTGFQVNFYPIRRPFHIHQQVAPAVDICDFSGDADIAVVHLNPDAWPGLLSAPQKEIVRRAKRSVGLWVWEMADIPENWRPVFDEVDAIWAPSQYCAEVFAAKTRRPVEVIPHVVRVDRTIPDPARAAAMRKELQLSERDRIILYAFDGSSYLVRKNPFALVNAFARSGLATKGWKLVLKTKHADDSEEAGKRLERLVGSSPGVLLIDRIVSRGTMDELMRAADIYASSHCAEGFGLTIAEAMAMGKIVVATDYSGSRDFLDANCGFPVGYRLQSLDDDHGHYRRGGVWAQVDEPQLADALVRATERVMAGDARIGEAARARIEDRLSLETVGAKMRQSILRLLADVKR